MEFVKLKPINRICPRCGNGNYMRIISGKNVGKLDVKCINCNSYYNYDELLKRDNSKPPIDAIPVEWLREFDLYYAGISGGSPYLKALIEAWQKEQEAQDG